MYYKRVLEQALLRLSTQFPAILLTGPRQVGKTTLLRHLSSGEMAYVTLDDIAVRSLAREDPAMFLKRFSPPLLIDEIQYAPQLLSYIKMAIDNDKQKGAFWMTGSQQFQMMRGVTESLAGRVGIVNLLGFSSVEKMGSTDNAGPFLPGNDLKRYVPKSSPDDVFRAIWQGSFPALVAEEGIDPAVYYNSYLQTYIQRDIRELANVGDLLNFTRFVRACAARTGQSLNFSNLARDVDVSVMTAKHWFSLLEASYQVILVPPLFSNATKRVVKTPKMYFLDTGFCAFLTGWKTPETIAHGAMRGAMFETHVVAEILKSWWFAGQMPQLYYYRDRDGREIDLVIEFDNKLHPIEIKSSATVKRSWAAQFKVLDRLTEERGPGVVICLSDQVLPIDDRATAVPIQTIGLVPPDVTV